MVHHGVPPGMRMVGAFHITKDGTMRDKANVDFARTLRATMTDAERHLWFHLRSRRLGGFRFRRQHPVERYITDFACLERHLVIELDGSQHLDSRSDVRRDACMRDAGFRILRFWNDDVLLRTSDVLTVILSDLQRATP
jgi:very-short-patch-repair endonuclease